jgi:hypothetical protein
LPKAMVLNPDSNPCAVSVAAGATPAVKTNAVRAEASDSTTDMEATFYDRATVWTQKRHILEERDSPPSRGARLIAWQKPTFKGQNAPRGIKFWSAAKRRNVVACCTASMQS